MKLYVWFILIPVSGCSTFFGFPESSWTTSSQVCTLPKIEQINTTDIFNNSSNYMVYKNVGKAWTGTVLKHTRWAAFIGCGIRLSPKDSGISVKTAEDCLRHCSDYSSATHFAIKSSRCYCLTDEPELNDDINDCRKICGNTMYTPCSSGRSALVFTFIKDVIIQPTTTYIEKECVTTTKVSSKFTVSDCYAPHRFGCKNTSIELIAKSWYEYQEFCLKDGSSVLFNRNTIGNLAAGKILWTPIFRTHIVVTGKLTKNDSCLAVSNAGTNQFTIESCASMFPFLCLGMLVVAVSLLAFILILSMVILSITAFKKIRILQEKLKKVNERLPGTEFSNYTGIEDTTEQVNDSAYKELSDNESQLGRNCNERKMDTSEDTMDYQGYLVPEQHYQTIPEVEVHYAAANIHVAERNSNKDKFDEDDYLEPVI